MRCSPNLVMMGSLFTLTTPEGECPSAPQPGRTPGGNQQPEGEGRAVALRLLALRGFSLSAFAEGL